MTRANDGVGKLGCVRQIRERNAFEFSSRGPNPRGRGSWENSPEALPDLRPTAFGRKWPGVVGSSSSLLLSDRHERARLDIRLAGVRSFPAPTGMLDANTVYPRGRIKSRLAPSAEIPSSCSS